MIARTRTKAGYTLIEVLISIIMLAVVWIASVGIIVIGGSSGSRAKHRMQAVYQIQRTVEDLRKKPFVQIVGGTTSVSIDTKGTPDSTADDLFGTQVVTVTTPDVHYKKVVVAVTWQEVMWGAAKSVTEYGGTYISDDPQAN